MIFFLIIIERIYYMMNELSSFQNRAVLSQLATYVKFRSDPSDPYYTNFGRY